MAIDPLAISTGQGQGFAQVLPQSGKTPYDLFLDAQKQGQAKAAQQSKNSQNAFKGLDKVAISGFVKDRQKLYDLKGQLQKHMSSQYQSDEGYNYQTDERFNTDLNKLKELDKFSTETQELFSETMKSRQDPEKWTPESIQKAEDFYKMDLDERYEYVKESGFPVLQAKKEVLDVGKFISGVSVASNDVTTEGSDVNGRITRTTNKALDPVSLETASENTYNAAIKGLPAPKQLLQDVIESMETNNNFAIAPDDQKEQIIKDEFKKRFKDIKTSQVGTKYKEASVSTKTSGGLSFGGGGALQNSKYNFETETRSMPGAKITKEKSMLLSPEMRKQAEKGWEMKKVVPTPKIGGQTKPDRFITQKKDGKEKIIDMSPEWAETDSDGKWWIVGTKLGGGRGEARAPYEGNEGSWNGTFSETPEELYDIMKNNKAQPNGIKSSATPKTQETPEERKNRLAKKYL